MKIILLEDVYKKGVAGEEVEVAAGFARNYLIPQGKAVRSTPGMLKQLENLRKQSEVRRAQRDKAYAEIAEKVEALTLYFPVRAGETGKLYGSVTSGEIAEALMQEMNLEIDRRRIGDRPIRELGQFDVPVRLDANLSPKVKVIVYREGEDPGSVLEMAEDEEVEAQVEDFIEGVEDEVIDAVEEEVEETVEEIVEEVVEAVEEEVEETVEE